MCGIIGVFQLDDNPERQENGVRAGMGKMRLRGPDAEGFYSGPGVALGHKRLAIIDLVSGTQPFIDPASGTVIVFNGEIFNFQALRETLIAKGRQFFTASDTEVLLQAYLEWDIDCLAHLSGMFAFAIYEPQQRRLFLARDRIGVKPLFWAMAGQTLVFASSIPALRCFPQVEPVMSHAAVSHYLTTCRSTFGRQTLYRDIKTLLPGEFMLAKRGRREIDIRRYWDFPIIPACDKLDPGIDVAAGQVRELLTQSVREQMISDVPLGGFLSGGIDSSILASLAHTIAPGHYDAYSIGYDRPGYNEFEFTRMAAAFRGMSCREIHLDEAKYPETWQFLIGQQGLPTSTPNEIPIYHLARELKRDFTVALSGEGADELFGGYARLYFSAYDYDRARHEPPLQGDALTPLDRAIQKLYRRPYLLCVPDHYFLLHSWMPFRLKKGLLQQEAWATLKEDAQLFSFYEDLFARFKACTTFDTYMHVHARINLEGLLFRVDACTMAASVEARVPFTDHRVAEYAFSLPDTYKINWRNSAAREAGANLNAEQIEKQNLIDSKILLRRAFQSDVPGPILARPKMSFPVPVQEWFNGPLLDMAREAAANSELARTFFKPGQIEKLFNTVAFPESSAALWPITNLFLWQTLCGVRQP